MSRLAKAPLVEAIFEMRWANTQKQDDNTLVMKFDKEDINFFPGQFHGVAAKNGFTTVETINEGLIPHIVSYRFRKHENTYPCYQIGLGLFTANQINSGYDWVTFKQDVLAGVRMLDDGHPLTLAKLPITHIELRYQDVFYLDEDESPSDFLQNKMNIGFIQPDDFLDVQFIKKNVEGHNIAFHVETTEPQGLLRFEIFQATINGKKGFAMNTIMRSEFANLNIDMISEWIESAHTTQKHAFETLINPTYLKSFR